MMHHDADVPTTSLLIDRRNFLVAATTSLLCAPAIVRASSLMPIKVVDWTPVPVPANEICEGGERIFADFRAQTDAGFARLKACIDAPSRTDRKDDEPPKLN
jgi:hypothetical protein